MITEQENFGKALCGVTEKLSKNLGTCLYLDTLTVLKKKKKNKKLKTELVSTKFSNCQTASLASEFNYLAWGWNQLLQEKAARGHHIHALRSFQGRADLWERR